MHTFKLVEDASTRTLDLFVIDLIAGKVVYAATMARHPALLASRLAALNAVNADEITDDVLAAWRSEDATLRIELADPEFVWSAASVFLDCGHIVIVADEDGIYPERFGRTAKAVLGQLAAQEK